jgi:hypothetical protein
MNFKNFKNFKNLALKLLSVLLITSCGGGTGTGSPTADPLVNSSPIAITGGMQSGTVGDNIILDGGNSTDPDGDSLSYRWGFVSTPIGSSASLASSSSAQSSFVPDIAGDYVVSLAVMDPSGASDSDSSTISASGLLMTSADAGPDQNVTTTFLTQLDGSKSSSPTGDLLSYTWRIVSQPSSANVSLSSFSVVNPTFTPSIDGQYVFDLLISDKLNINSADSVIVNSMAGNSASVALAGYNQGVLLGDLVQLDGSGSSDADGDLLTYQWLIASQPDGSSASLSGANTPLPTFTADVAGVYTVSLVVNDGLAMSVADFVEITAQAGNMAPQSDAGNDMNVLTGELVSLDGSGSSDPEGAPLSYNWQFVSIPGGSSALLTNPTTVNPSFTPDIDGTYVVDLVVSDSELLSTGDQVSITSSSDNSAPNTNAGTDQNVSTGDLVLLDGSGSSDPEGTPLSYAWQFVSIPSGSSAQLTNASAVMPSFTPDFDGSYIVELVVSDGVLFSAGDRVSIISSTANSTPNANAGIDQNILTGDLLILDGSASNDADEDALSYAWSFSSRPIGSTATIAGSNQVMPTFIADAVGTFVVSLVVNDGLVDSLSDTVVVNATVANSAPTAVAGPDQSGTVGDNIILDGGNSTDPDDDSLSYQWDFVSTPIGSNASLASSSSAQSDFVADVAGSFMVELLVNDGTKDSLGDQLLVNITVENQPPVADAGATQSFITGGVVTLNGSGSSDPDGDLLTYTWSFTSRPSGSLAVLSSTTESSPSFTADIDGLYIVQLVVNDGLIGSPADSTTVTSSTPGGVSITDTFAGDGPLLSYITNNASALPDVYRTNGRYHARLLDNTSNITLHYNNDQGRLDAKRVSFPFEYIVRNIGIGTITDSQSPPSPTSNPYMFAGIQIHVTDLNSRNSAHMVVGHRGSTPFTVEGKNTVNGSSSVNDDGANIVPTGRADLRLVAHADKSLTWYWQQPNPSPGVQADSWNLYRGTGDFPGSQTDFGDQVYIGLITYAYIASSVPFVGTADSVELVGE